MKNQKNMKRGSSYKSLDDILRMSMLSIMNHYQVDNTNKKFITLLENVVSDIKEGKQLHQSIKLNKEHWNY